MGWRQTVEPLLILTPSGGFTGLFVYSPVPGHGNLIASITAAAGTDPYGNVFTPTISSYGTGRTTSIGAGAVNFHGANINQTPASIFLDTINNLICLAATSGFAKLAIIDGANNNHGMLFDPTAVQFLLGSDILSAGAHTAALLELHGDLTLTGTVQGIISNALVVPVTMTPNLLGNWGAGAPAPRYEYEPISGGRLRLGGQITATGANVAGTTFFTFPAAFPNFTRDQFFPAPSNTVFNNGFTVKALGGSKSVQVVLATALGNTVCLDGVVIPLD